MSLLLRDFCKFAIPLNRIRSNNTIKSLVCTKTNFFSDFARSRPISSRPITYDICKVSLVKCRNYTNETKNDKASATENTTEDANAPEKLGLVARFKQMYRDYWYVLVPVHVATSVCWLGGFYYLAKSGVDVIALLKSIGISEKFTDPLKDSSMGYVALTYALYKIATPIRYTVTLGGTTISIKYLQAWGYIKPIPSREKLKEMYQVKKDGFQEMYTETRLELKHRTQQMKDRKDHVMSDIAKYKQEMQDVKESELKNK
ncbi:protein FAM210A [Arctopsyche grandis]|uniref:protein FAM210A n=1 Tax=Arctopsyche grandis TaxID=121162 RepID=UPI00406DA4C3